MVRDAVGALALTAESVVALREARTLVRTSPAVIASMMEPRLTAPPRPADETLATQVGLAVARAARIVRRATCLVQAVAAYRVLARRGIYPILHIGHDAQQTTTFSAHAWLEFGGRPVLGEPSQTPFLRPPV